MYVCVLNYVYVSVSGYRHAMHVCVHMSISLLMCGNMHASRVSGSRNGFAPCGAEPFLELTQTTDTGVTILHLPEYYCYHSRLKLLYTMILWGLLHIPMFYSM